MKVARILEGKRIERIKVIDEREKERARRKLVKTGTERISHKHLRWHQNRDIEKTVKLRQIEWGKFLERREKQR